MVFTKKRMLLMAMLCAFMAVAAVIVLADDGEGNGSEHGSGGESGNEAGGEEGGTRLPPDAVFGQERTGSVLILGYVPEAGGLSAWWGTSATPRCSRCGSRCACSARAWSSVRRRRSIWRPVSGSRCGCLTRATASPSGSRTPKSVRSPAAAVKAAASTAPGAKAAASTGLAANAAAVEVLPGPRARGRGALTGGRHVLAWYPPGEILTSAGLAPPGSTHG